MILIEFEYMRTIIKQLFSLIFLINNLKKIKRYFFFSYLKIHSGMSKTGHQEQGVKAREDEAVIKLVGGQQLCVHGAFSLRVISGCVLINGSFRCTPEHSSVPIYAPYTTNASTIAHDTQSGAPESVIAFSDHKGPLPSYRFYINPIELFHHDPHHTNINPNLVNNPNAFGNPFRFRTLRILNDLSITASLITPYEWQSLGAEILRYNSNSSTPPRVVICGGKGSGKSTFARFLVNTLLAKYPAVAFMDCDPGQPELSPPGMISLSLVKEPLLGTPSTHMMRVGTPAIERVGAVYMGEVSPAPIVGYYIQGLKYLTKKLENYKVPLIVNTCGWVTHLGYDIQLDIIGMSVPDFIVQISTDGYDIINKEDISEVLYDVRERLPFMRKLDASSKVAPPTALSLTSAEGRTAQVLAYFGDHETAIAAGKAWAVPFEEVAVGFVSQKVSPSQTFYALNGAVVGLCYNEVPTKAIPTMGGKTDKKLPTFLVDTPRPCNCLGLGIIKSIDVENGIFYIMTPVDLVNNIKPFFLAFFIFARFFL